MKYVRYGCFGIIGGILTQAGVTYTHWEFYVVLIVTAIVGEIRYAEANKK